MSTATANEYGVRWAPSKSGKIRIALARRDSASWRGWTVWAIYTGTHDLVQGVGANFGPTENGWHNARAYANKLWRER